MSLGRVYEQQTILGFHRIWYVAQLQKQISTLAFYPRGSNDLSSRPTYVRLSCPGLQGSLNMWHTEKLYE